MNPEATWVPFVLFPLLGLLMMALGWSGKKLAEWQLKRRDRHA